MFLSPGWSCPKEDQASHLVALLHPTNCPVSEQYIALSLRFCVSFPPKRELLPRCCHPMDLSSRRRLNRFAAFRTLSDLPYRSCLLGPEGPRRRGTSPVWKKHRCLQMMTPRTRIAGEDTRIASLRKTRPGPDLMLRRRGGDSHVVQANAPPFGATWTGLFATPVDCDALATSLQNQLRSEVLSMSSARVRTRTGRIRSMLPTLTAPFFVRLNVSTIRFTRPTGADRSGGMGQPAASPAKDAGFAARLLLCKPCGFRGCVA